MDSTVLQYYQSRNVFAEAFHNVIWEENEDSIVFAWKDVKDNYANYIFIKDDNDSTVLQEAINWKGKETSRKII